MAVRKTLGIVVGTRRPVARMVLTTVGLIAATGFAQSPIPQRPALDSTSIVHHSVGGLDEFVACAQQVWRRRVLVAYFADVSGLRGKDCPDTAAGLERIVDEAGAKMVTADDWALVYAKAEDSAPVVRPEWTALHVTWRVGDLRSEGRRPMSEAERAGVGEAVRRVARPPIVWRPPLGRAAGVPRDTIDVAVFVAPLQLGPGRPESVVAHYGAGSWARLVYGEVRDGRYVPLWDSPLFDGAWPTYHDLDGDGVQEIIMQGRVDRDGWSFAAFTAAGVEITRLAG